MLRQQQERAQSSTGLGFWRAFVGYPLARASLYVFALIGLLAAFADFLAPYRNFYTNRDLNFSPPTVVHIFDDQGRLTRPFIHHYERSYDAQGRPIYQVDTSITYEIRFFVRTTDPRDYYTPFPLNLIPEPVRDYLGIRVSTNLKLMGIDAPMDEVPFYPWGSDIVGNDVFSSILYGSRWSLAVGLGGSLLAMLIGLAMALLARVSGGLVDAGVMGVSAMISVMPSVFLLLAILSLFHQLNLPFWLAILFILIDAALVDLGTLARSFRARIRMLKARGRARAFKRIDVHPPRSVLDHLLQHGLGYIVVAWGFVLAVQRSFVEASYLERWWILLPAPFLVLVMLAWTILGDALRQGLEYTLPEGRQS